MSLQQTLKLEFLALGWTCLLFGSWIAGLVLEKAFEARQEHPGFGPSLRAVFQHPDMPHVWANTICLSGAVLAYNTLSVVRRHLGEGGLLRLLTSPLPDVVEADARKQPPP